MCRSFCGYISCFWCVCVWGGSGLRGLLAPETVPLRPPTLRRQGPAAPFPFYLKSRWYIRTNPGVGKKGRSHTASTLAELTHRSILKYNPVPRLGLFFGLLSHDQCCLCPLRGLPCCWALSLLLRAGAPEPSSVPAFLPAFLSGKLSYKHIVCILPIVEIRTFWLKVHQIRAPLAKVVNCCLMRIPGLGRIGQGTPIGSSVKAALELDRPLENSLVLASCWPWVSCPF